MIQLVIRILSGGNRWNPDDKHTPMARSESCIQLVGSDGIRFQMKMVNVGWSVAVIGNHIDGYLVEQRGFNRSTSSLGISIVIHTLQIRRISIEDELMKYTRIPISGSRIDCHLDRCGKSGRE
jgi:hypothetical protein